MQSLSCTTDGLIKAPEMQFAHYQERFYSYLVVHITTLLKVFNPFLYAEFGR